MLGSGRLKMTTILLPPSATAALLCLAFYFFARGIGEAFYAYARFQETWTAAKAEDKEPGAREVQAWLKSAGGSES